MVKKTGKKVTAKRRKKEPELLSDIRNWIPEFMREDDRKRQLFYLVKRKLTLLVEEGRRRKLLEDDTDFLLLTALLHEAADVIGEGLLHKWKPDEPES